MRAAPGWHLSLLVCVYLLKRQNATDSDELHAMTVDHFVRVQPQSAEMAELSMLQQTLEGSMGINDYACTTVFMWRRKPFSTWPATERNDAPKHLILHQAVRRRIAMRIMSHIFFLRGLDTLVLVGKQMQKPRGDR